MLFLLVGVLVGPGCQQELQDEDAYDSLLRVYGEDPDTLNPIIASDNVSDAFHRHVYENLADRSFPNPDVWENELAESWEFDEEKNTYTIHLRKGVKWHPISLPDGTPLPETEFTADDVVFTFQCILNENVEAGSLRSFYQNPNAKEEKDKYKISVRKIDDYTVEVKWSEPYILSHEFTIGMMVIPRHVYSVDEHGEPVTFDFRNSKEFADLFNNHWANTKMCGTGPMMYSDWERDRRLVLVRNPDYWGEPYPFKKAVYRCIPNSNTARKKLLRNEADFVGYPEKQHFLEDQTSAAVEDGRVKLVSFDYPGYRYLGFNLKKPLFQDKNVRWAISHAVPVQDIIDDLYFGLAKRVNGPFAPGSSSSDDTIPFIKHDLRRSRELLDEAGWVDTNGNGIRDKMIDGKLVEAKFDLMIFADSPTYRNIALMIRENLRQIQVDMTLTQTQWALMLQKLRKKEFDATILGWSMTWKSDPFQIWHGSQADAPDSSNAIGYSNPEVDKLIEKLRKTTDESKQSAIFQEIHRKIHADQPYVFLFAEKRTGGHDSRLDNIKFYKIRPGYDSREWTASRPRRRGR